MGLDLLPCGVSDRPDGAQPAIRKRLLGAVGRSEQASDRGLFPSAETHADGFPVAFEQEERMPGLDVPEVKGPAHQNWYGPLPAS